ncbi:MAG TPA: DcaP family trimeric outer membrane transporter [Vicinamibacteria bacterium]|nr:DcaP family trimeric outer membrane transporter [Vicinamibacteria bacterium]
MSCWKSSGLLVAFLAIAGVASARAEEANAESQPAQQGEPKPRMDIYGFIMLDTGYQSGANDPDWFDVVRPVKLPSFENEFGAEGNWFAGVRQTRLGVKNFLPTDLGELRTTFEFELFGTGVDAGQTTFRLRHAYGELGKFGAGQYWSPFMDIDVFPNSIEYWGPNGMVFFRNVQVRYMPLQGATSVVIALERPGASADQGVYADRIELEGVDAHFPLPDFSAHVRRTGEWGHLQIAGIYRRIEWEDLNDDRFDLTGSANGWGINVSTNLKRKKDTVRASLVYGEGIQNYMNDAPVDVGIQNNFSDPVTPIVGKALPLLGLVLFYDRTWNDQWTSSFGYSLLDIDNTDGQAANAFKAGHYALGNLLYYPAPNFFVGGELQWGRRENFSDGWSYDDVRVQFSAKYNFSHRLGGQ